MAELVSAALIKAFLPALVSLAKESASIIKDQKFKLNAQSTAEKLSKTVIDICTVKTMWSKDEGVKIDQFYYPSKIMQRRAPLQQIPLTRLFRERSVIEGIVGQGKSILLRHLCQLAAESEIIPIFIELKSISDERTFNKLILDFLEVAGISGGEFIFSHLASTGRIALILDGFDEIPKNHISNTIYEIEQLRIKYDLLGIIVSSRPYTDIQNLAGFDVYCLASLDRSDYDGFLSKLIHDPIKRFNIRQAIDEAPENIKDVIATPLMLTLLVMVYESESEIPSSLPGFFERLFGTVFSRHDRLKAGFDRRHYSGLSESKLQKLFDSFCFMLMQADSRRDVSRRAFTAAFERAVQYTPDCSCELDAFRKDIVDVACLMLDDGFDIVTFLHKSIMEYHAASFIKNSSDDVARKFYNRAQIDYNSWDTVLVFLSNIDEFRYGREYVLEAYPTLLAEIRAVLKSKDQAALLSFILSVYPDLSFIMRENAFAGITLGSTINNDLVRKLTNLLYETAYKSITAADSRTIQKAIRSSPKKGLGELAISPSSFFENFDMSAIWQGLPVIESLFTQIIEKYEEVVATENRKSDIFE